jgi:hypothetical protein
MLLISWACVYLFRILFVVAHEMPLFLREYSIRRLCLMQSNILLQFLTIVNFLYRVPHELRSLLRGLIPELILSQKHHIHMRPIRDHSGFMSFYNTVNTVERKEEHCVFIEICC